MYASFLAFCAPCIWTFLNSLLKIVFFNKPAAAVIAHKRRHIRVAVAIFCPCKRARLHTLKSVKKQPQKKNVFDGPEGQGQAFINRAGPARN